MKDATKAVIDSFYTGKIVEIDYVNWRSERRVRRIVPRDVRFGTNEWHPTPQWFLLAVCLEKCDLREFALSGIRAWRSADDQTLPWREEDAS